MSTEGLHEQVSIQEEYILSGPGSRMRMARETAQWSVEDVARQLRLKPKLIRDMEDDDYNNPPKIVFLRGYLRGYAKLLNLPEDEIIASFNALGVEEVTQQSAPVLQKLPKTTHNLVRWVSVLALLLILSAVLLWWQSQKVDRSTSNAMKVAEPVTLESQFKAQPDIKPEGPAASEKPSQNVEPVVKGELNAPLIEDLTENNVETKSSEPSDRNAILAERTPLTD